jgi:2-methylaconitate cis-trans-isomerase PrpF
MDWADSVGAVTGRLLPTGRPTQEFTLADGTVVAGSLVDAANPMVWVAAADLGLSGSELGEIDDDDGLIARLRDLRGRAAVAAGSCTDPARVDLDSPGLPMVGLVAAPEDYRTLSGGLADAATMDLRARVVFMNRLHESVPGTGSICLAAASRTPGTVVADLLAASGVATDTGVLRIGHPSGVTPAEVRATGTAEPPYVRLEELGFARTARRLLDGRAYVPCVPRPDPDR